MTNPQIKIEIIDLFDSLVAAIPKEQYADICADLVDEFESRAETANEELEDED